VADASPILPAPRPLTVHLPALTLAGQHLTHVALHGFASGQSLGDAPVVVVVGGITASPFPLGDGTQPGWWPSLAHPELIDLSQHTLLCPAWPGQGSTWDGLEGPVDEVVARLPALSVLDLADWLALWLGGIGCAQPVRFVGASMGALVGIALAARHPHLVSRLVSISAGLRPDGWGTATRHLQRELVRDGIRRGDPKTGMARARQLGMLTYRGREELDTRFGALTPGQQQPPVAAYLDHHGRQFAERFLPATFLLLSEAIDRCQLTPDPAALRALLGQVTAQVVVVGVPGDLLFPFALQTELHRELQAAGAHSSLWKLDSLYGHDAFLADQDALADLLRHTGILRDGAEAPLLRPRYEGVGQRPIKTVRIGLIGCGTVGRGLLALLAAQGEALAQRDGVRFEVVGIAVRNLASDRGDLARAVPHTTDLLALVSDPQVDVVVEVAGGEGPVADAVRAALAAGKPVVTANKSMLAKHLAQLAALSERAETPLLCEAAVAAAIPILRHLSRRADEVREMLAIVNGTTNFLLTRMGQDEWPLARALLEAQRLGLAEADPSADISGRDAVAKLSILVYRSFGVWVLPDQVPVRGIEDLLPADCDLAESMGYRVRHVARARRLPGSGALDLAVEPALLPAWHLLASVEEEYNAVYLSCEHAGDLALFGKGAGAAPTATALLGDLLELSHDSIARWPVPRPANLADGASLAWPRYLRVTATAHPTLDKRVESHLRRAGIAVLDRAVRAERDHAHLGFLVAPCDDAALAAVCTGLADLGRVAALLALRVVR